MRIPSWRGAVDDTRAIEERSTEAAGWLLVLRVDVDAWTTSRWEGGGVVKKKLVGFLF